MLQLKTLSKYGLLPKETRMTYKKFKRGANNEKILVEEGYVGKNALTDDFMPYIIASILNKQYRVVSYESQNIYSQSNAKVQTIHIYSDETQKKLDNFIYGPAFMIFGSTNNSSTLQNIHKTTELLNLSEANNNFGIIKFKTTTQTYQDENGNNVPVYFDLVKKQVGSDTATQIVLNGIKRVTKVSLQGTTITLNFAIEFEDANAADDNTTMYIEAFGITAVLLNNDQTDIAYRQVNDRYSLQIGYKTDNDTVTLDYNTTDIILTNFVVPAHNNRYPKDRNTAYLFTYEIIF